MLYEYDDFDGGTVHITGLRGFDAARTLECGQCFRFWEDEQTAAQESAETYALCAFGKVLHVRQVGDELWLHPSTPVEFETIWRGYFGLDADYEGIMAELSAKDEYVKEAAEFYGGIRILNQEPWECLVSFIISQNNRIPQIKKVLENMSAAFGIPVGEGRYAFPSPQQLLEAGEAGVFACKAGFRAKYVIDAAQKVASGEIDLDAVAAMPTKEARDTLMTIKGVGGKIADCVLLFSFGRREVFPTDVWVKRVMRRLYFGGAEVGIEEIHALARERFGQYAGIAQEYLYALARERQIGGKNEAAAYDEAAATVIK